MVDGIGGGNRGAGRARGARGPAEPAKKPTTPEPPAPPVNKGWAPKPQHRPPVKARPPPAPPPTKEEQVRDVLRDGPRGAVGEATEYWNALAEKGGVPGAVGTVMGGLLELSGLPALERSSAELGARVGVGDSTANVAKAGAKVAFDAGVVMLNGLAAGKAVASVAGASRAASLEATVVRHYTSAETAAKIMQSGEIWASRVGNAGMDKVYLLADGGSFSGMSLLRRLNTGLSAKQTVKAIEFDLTRMPPEVAARFVESAAKGPLGLEHFITYAGTLDFNAFRGAVRVLDTEQLAVTLGQLSKAGASLGRFGTGTVDASRAVRPGEE